VQIDYAEHIERQNKYRGFSLTLQEVKERYAGYLASKAIVTYKDGSTASIYCSKDLPLVEAGLFERFPGIHYLPLVFDFNREDGSALHLVAQKVELRPVETSIFTVPPDYKIISTSELRELNK
jgi:hypothetical protein